MITDLDHDHSLDPGRVGTKTAHLARAKRASLPVLGGFVVEASMSRGHMALGASTLASRGSGAARLAVSGTRVEFADDLIDAGRRVGESLVARSSTLLEGSGEWAGAFASYVDVTPDQLPKAIVGCWASAFTVAALELQEVRGVAPGSIEMAVLVQPYIRATSGGTAEMMPDGSLVVRAVEGSPIPLLQGWVRGVEGRADSGGAWSGADLVELVGRPPLDRVRESLMRAYELLGSNHCEWAIADQLWILQLDVRARPEPTRALPGVEIPAELVPTARALVVAPGRLGEELVLPWGVGGGIPDPAPVETPGAAPVIRETALMATELTTRVWGSERGGTIPEEARHTLDVLKGPAPDRAVETISSLRRPDRELAVELMTRLLALRSAMVQMGAAPDLAAAWHLSLDDAEAVLAGETRSAPDRVGTQPWEPLIASVVLEHGTLHHGSPAAAGIGAGLRVRSDDQRTALLTHRGVITAAQPLAALAQLLWDAAGLVTWGGSPAAHLFESARSLGLPAVCGVELQDDGDQIVAVDGFSGVVATMPLRGPAP